MKITVGFDRHIVLVCLHLLYRHQHFSGHCKAVVGITPAINSLTFVLPACAWNNGWRRRKKGKRKVWVVLTAPQVITCLCYLLICDKSAHTVIGDTNEIAQCKQNNAKPGKINEGNVSQLYNEPMSPHSNPQPWIYTYSVYIRPVVLKWVCSANKFNTGGLLCGLFSSS